MTLHYSLQKIRASLLRVSPANYAGAGQGGDGACGGPRQVLPHHLLQVRGLWPVAVLRVRGTWLLPPGRPCPVQELQCQASAEHDHGVVEKMAAYLLPLSGESVCSGPASAAIPVTYLTSVT